MVIYKRNMQELEYLEIYEYIENTECLTGNFSYTYGKHIYTIQFSTRSSSIIIAQEFLEVVRTLNFH